MNDTNPAVARAQIALLRSASTERRSEVAFSLSQTVIDLSRRALRDQMPSASEQKVLLRWVGLHYGRELESRLREHLARKAG